MSAGERESLLANAAAGSDRRKRARRILDGIPAFDLSHSPTALERFRAMDPYSPSGASYIKRDDCTGLALGGNKVRKLEYLIARAKQSGATTVVSASGIQSNHIRQTAASAAKAGLKFDAIVAPAFEDASSDYLENGNALLDRLFGANLIPVANEGELDEALERHCAKLRREGQPFFVIPLGGSDGYGSLGYVRCAWEILDQIDELELDTTHVFLATGSGGTQAGLLAGFHLAGSSIRVVGLSISDSAEIKSQKVRSVLSQLRSHFGELLPTSVDEDVIVYDEYAGGGYSRPTRESDNWVLRVARTDGVLLDPVYTGKAVAGMASLLGGKLADDVRSPIFLHTGGIPVLFADPDLLRRAGSSGRTAGDTRD